MLDEGAFVLQKALKAAKAASNKDSLELLHKYDRQFGARYE